MKSKERVHIGAVCIIGVALICILLPLGNLNGIFDYKGERIELKENDIVSVRKYGKYRLGQMQNKTKKGNYIIIVKQYY